MKIVFSDHALFEMKRRSIDPGEVMSLFEKPCQRIVAKNNRIIIQGKYLNRLLGKEMLLRVIGREEENSFSVITVYATSKTEKYWQKEGFE